MKWIKSILVAASMQFFLHFVGIYFFSINIPHVFIAIVMVCGIIFSNIDRYIFKDE